MKGPLSKTYLKSAVILFIKQTAIGLYRAIQMSYYALLLRKCNKTENPVSVSKTTRKLTTLTQTK